MSRTRLGVLAMIDEDVPLVICVTPDAEVRERVARQLNGCGVVLMCADMTELRAVLRRASREHGRPPPMLAPLAAEATVEGPVRGDPARLMATRPILAVGDLVIDPGSHVASWRGIPLPLTRLEWELLGSLASPPPIVWTYERLFGTVWGGAYLGDTSILHSAMKRLRRKLRDAGDGVMVETVRGIGYRLALS